MAINVRDRLPEGNFGNMTKDGPNSISTQELFGKKKVVLFSVPGAFTPTCSNSHLPGYIKHAADIKAKGIDTIACMSVNDTFVMDAWGKDRGVGDKVLMLADGGAEFAKKIGMDMDLTARGLGVRSKRYAMAISDGEVKVLNLEEAPGQVSASSAETLCSMVDKSL